MAVEGKDRQVKLAVVVEVTGSNRVGRFGKAVGVLHRERTRAVAEKDVEASDVDGSDSEIWVAVAVKISDAA